jgi:hypothetical protein
VSATLTLPRIDDEEDTNGPVEPVRPRCVLCGQPEAEGDFYGWGLWTGEWKGGICSACYLYDRKEAMEQP